MTITLPIDIFCPGSQGDWSQMCAVADMPRAPAELIPEVRKDDYLSWTDEAPVRERLMVVYAQMREVAAKGYRVRYNCCSKENEKERLALSNRNEDRSERRLRLEVKPLPADRWGLLLG